MLLENRMVIDDDLYIENDEQNEDDIFALINEECELFDRWEEEQCKI